MRENIKFYLEGAIVDNIILAKISINFDCLTFIYDNTWSNLIGEIQINLRTIVNGNIKQNGPKE